MSDQERNTADQSVGRSGDGPVTPNHSEAGATPTASLDGGATPTVFPDPDAIPRPSNADAAPPQTDDRDSRPSRALAHTDEDDIEADREAHPTRAKRATTGSHSSRSRILVFLAAALALIVLLVAVDAVALIGRIERMDIVPTSLSEVDDSDQTWVIVGSDNRDWIVGDEQIYGSGSTRVADHADIVIVIHKTATGSHTFMVPRDLWVRPTSGEPGRLTMMMARSPNDFAEAMCASLGIPVDHLLMVRMSTFVNIIDAIGGIDVDFPYDTRDEEAKLSVTAGVHRLDGQQALAYVRSRQAEHLIDGEWVPVNRVEGANQSRPSAAAEVLALVMKKVKSVRDPVTLQRLAWAVSGGTVVDSSTSLLEVPALIGEITGKIDVLPVSPNSGKIVALMSDETRDTLARAGYPEGGCRIGA
ncbi:MAG: LCP family protein [Propionibacteriaceae bacterium]|jgi:LCP family protein required for cell wall assembly|nr:LCP family protein [Propionibacteriaceae bacterium]